MNEVPKTDPNSEFSYLWDMQKAILAAIFLISFCSASVPDSIKFDSAKSISNPIPAVDKDSTAKAKDTVEALPIIPATASKPVHKEETDLDVQKRMAETAEKSLLWMIVSGFLTFISVLIAIFAIKASTSQSERALRKELGSIEIDFDNTRGIFETEFENPTEKQVRLNFSILYTGTSMVRLISTTIDLVKCDYMLLPADWASRLKAFEQYSHAIILPGNPLKYDVLSDKIPLDVWKELVTPIESPFIKCEPLCFLGRLKFQNGIGETWIKPFIFRFTWDASQLPQIETWYVNCKPWKVYPTFRTNLYEWRLKNPKLGNLIAKFLPKQLL